MNLPKINSNRNSIIFFLVGLSLPFPILFNRITVALLLLHSLVTFVANRRHRTINPYTGPGPWLLIAFFLAYFLTDLLSPTPDPMQVVDTYLLFPVFGAIGILNQDFDNEWSNRNNFLKGFLIGNVTCGILNLIRAFYFSIDFTEGGLIFDSSVWGNTPLAESVNHVGNYFFSEFYSWFLHPSYAAVYLEVCIAYLLYLISSRKIQMLHGLVIIAFLIINLYLLSSRIAILSVFILLTVSSYYLSRSSKVKFALLFFAVILTAVGLLNPRSSEIYSPDVLKQNERIQAWHSSIVAIKDNWLTGVGITNVKPVLKQQYLELGYETNATQLLNAHNQFLETLLASGLTAFILLLSTIFVLTILAHKNGDYLLLAFCSCITVHFLVESMLSRHQGIILFASYIVISRWPFGTVGPQSWHKK